ncbi:hypothetical protein DVK85_08300 [Flavobacterium arcticum]|uniref:PorT family protein n=1 Tax=Flavobacterium arcticum TaxID=1784713 RepID=A0A345HCC9_9FLAO|nr:hypothetical protein [Flavobacterium arcticum]AXG74239.1 hypothetical protein DVK85_08300 [Flavobacterium arcticum]KAF2508174.1 hypothetical protein E0W72_11000 [Flavobacterium arcticum]
MKTVIFYVVASLCLLVTKLNAQTFEERAHEISKNIEEVTKQQKDSLKMEVEQVNKMLENNEISEQEADARKKEYATKRAKNIEVRVTAEEEKLTQLVKDKVDGKVDDSRVTRTFGVFSYSKGSKSDTITRYKKHEPKRTTSQFVFALGVNRVVVDGEIDTDNYKWRSDFYEWGVAWNTRIFKENNLLRAKYGLSLQYNNLRPDDNKKFVSEGGKTYLEDSGLDLKVSRLRYVNLVVPVHLEFDFTKKRTGDEKVYFPSHNSFRVGLGGYAGVNVKEKQILKYKENGNRQKDKEKGDFNVSDFVYGVSAYVGYRDISLYAKYDLQPIFQNNDIDQNNLSLGIRFDFN